jgi:NADH:ubiquinone oxidoreductase subunit H
MISTGQISAGQPSSTAFQLVEFGKFVRLTLIWLTVIFGAVWAACFIVGVALPSFCEATIQPQDVAAAWANGLRALTPIVAIMVFIPINAMFMVLAERRALALFTVRLGPNRVGPDGLLQTAADAIKLLFKEDITPRGADAVMFTLAPIIFFAPSIFGVMPLMAAATNNSLFSIVNLPTGIFFVLAMSSIPVVGLIMGSWASNNKYSLVGGLRSAAQAISYEIPLVLSIITICMMAGSLDVVQIAQQQRGGILNWNILGGGALVAGLQHSPIAFGFAILLVICCVILFGIYATSACAEVNRIPFDLPEAESELVSGYNTEFSGIKFAIFFLAEFTNLFVVATVATVMFLGGGSSPVPPEAFGMTNLPLSDPWLLKLVSDLLANLPPFFSTLIYPPTLVAALWVIFKVYSLVIFAILVRGTLPRFRIDQLLDFGWKRLIPLTLILLLAVTYLRELV